MVTPAGKPRYNKPATNVTVTPMDVIKLRIEEKIGEIIAKDKTGLMAAHLASQEQAADTISNKNDPQVVFSDRGAENILDGQSEGRFGEQMTLGK